MTDTIAERIAGVNNRIAEAAARVDRDPTDVLLVAVTKTHGLDAVQAAYQAGIRNFGENRVEEADQKITASLGLPADAVWHMIGHIQSRKTDDVAHLFLWVHSIDRLKIARRLSEASSGAGQILRVLLEVNVSGEESKYGFDLADWPSDLLPLDRFCSEIQHLLVLPGLQVEGLMTMAPFSDDPEDARPVFQRLRLLRDVLRERFPGISWPHLSMGMTLDYEVAIEEGATIVRVGTAIFGGRSA
jgi:pyridoxal phosphate enzyme (YggS family)